MVCLIIYYLRCRVCSTSAASIYKSFRCIMNFYAFQKCGKFPLLMTQEKDKYRECWLILNSATRNYFSHVLHKSNYMYMYKHVDKIISWCDWKCSAFGCTSGFQKFSYHSDWVGILESKTSYFRGQWKILVISCKY